MALTNREKQRAYKARMYKAGYKQMVIWVQREPEGKPPAMDRACFIRKLDELTIGWTKKRLSNLYAELVRIIQGKKEGVQEKP
jgi:hypothetical protein